MLDSLFLNKGKVAVLSALMASLMSVSSFAFASDGGSTTSGGISSITGAISTITDVMSSMFSLMTSNPLLVVFLASSLVAVGIRMFSRLRRAAGG